MILDQYETTATLYTEGIALSCFTKDKEQKCHIAFFRPVEPRHGDGHEHKHNLDLTITRIDSNGEQDVSVAGLDLNAGQKLVLEVVNPIYRECTRYTPGKFRRLSPDNDSNDYRWVVDMQEEIHPRDRLELKVGRHPKDFLSTLLEVNNGLFYTENLTEFRVEKVSPDDTNGSFFGKIANRVAAKIACKEGNDSGVILRNADGNKGILLKKLPNVHYEISFKNVRVEPDPRKETDGRVDLDSPKDNGDFPMFYGVLLAHSAKEFDLRKIGKVKETVQRVCNRAELYNACDLSPLASDQAKETTA